MNAAMDLGKATATIEIVSDPLSVRALWQQLESESDVSCFQAWPWIGTWLATLPASVRPKLVTWNPDGRPAAAGLLVGHTRRRSKIVPARGLFLSETGLPGIDMITVEHNGFIARRGQEREGVSALLGALLESGEGWDDLVVSGLDASSLPLYSEAAAQAGLRVVEALSKPYYTVDLAALRAEKRDYLSALSSNSRYQIRRALKAYEQRGALQAQLAASAEEALAFFDRMGELHQQYWIARGQPGAFASPHFGHFHRRLIRDHFADGAVQLIAVRAGAEEIGYLYNLVHRGRVYSYQSGFAYTEDQHLKPGLVSHSLAITRNQELGHDVYDLLAGASQYKRSLSMHESAMSWLSLERPRARFALERMAQQLARRMKAGR